MNLYLARAVRDFDFLRQRVARFALPSSFALRSWSRRLADSSRRFCAADKLRPPRLIKYVTIRIAEPIPLGLTSFLARTRAIVCASLVNRPSGGKVDTVCTF